MDKAPNLNSPRERKVEVSCEPAESQLPLA